MPAIAITHRADIIQRVAQGHRLLDIASDYGISIPAISQQLADDPEYQIAMIAGLDSKLEQREAEIESADDLLKLARGRELLSHARWRAERLNSALYGQKQANVSVAVGVQVATGMSDAQLAEIASRSVADRTVDEKRSPKKRAETVKRVKPVKSISKATK